MANFTSEPYKSRAEAQTAAREKLGNAAAKDHIDFTTRPSLTGLDDWVFEIPARRNQPPTRADLQHFARLAAEQGEKQA